MMLTHQGFLGQWSLARDIEDQYAGAAQFAGQAVLSELGESWRYAESGTLTMASGNTFAAERIYLWVPVEGGFDILFEDARPFHTLRFQSPEAGHWCDPDQYNVAYAFSNWPNWASVWRVEGPRKSYTMTTRYSR